MNLLFDQNLSPRLIEHLADVYPESSHVSQLALDKAPDEVVWAYAREHDQVIVTRDADFSDLVVVRGFPPKIIWVQLGNATTREIEAALRRHRDQIVAFCSDPQAGLLSVL